MTGTNLTYDTFTTPGGDKMAILPEHDLEELVQIAEDLHDCRSVTEFMALLKAGVAETVPGDVVRRIIEGGNPVRVWRAYRGLTQSQLETASGISQVTISKIEKGGTIGNVKTLVKLADALDVSVDDLLED